MASLLRKRFSTGCGLLLLMLSGLGLGLAPALAQTAEDAVIVTFGDSLTAGYGLAPDASVPARLEAALKADGMAVTVINAGVSGDTTSGGRARLPWVLDSLGGDKPSLLVLELGANDALRGIDPALTRQNLDAMLTLLKARGIPVLLSGMKAPPNMGKSYGDAFNAIYPALAGKYQVAFDPFFLAGVAARPALNQQDGMHPNAEGAALIAARLAPIVKHLLRDTMKTGRK